MEESKFSFYERRTIEWNGASNSVVMIDQTLLPTELKLIECKSVSEVIDAIKTMKIRGAPAIGVAGAMGVALSTFSSSATKRDQLLRDLEPDAIALKAARPTAVNLSWGVNQMVDHLRSSLPNEFSEDEPKRIAVDFVMKLADSDVETNKKLSDLGAKLFRNNETVLTHCN